jgi:hypothetical protein
MSVIFLRNAAGMMIRMEGRRPSVESIEMTLKNSLSHGRRRSARPRAIRVYRRRTTRSVDEGSATGSGVNGGVRWGRWGLVLLQGLKLRLSKGRAAQRQPSEQISATIIH